MFAARAAAAALALIACGHDRTGEPTPTAPPETRALAQLARRLAPAAPRTEGARVTLTGTVLDASAKPVASVQIVARGLGGEVIATSGADGRFRLVVQRGEQRVFVRDERVMTSASRQRPRIHGAPRANTVDAPDEALLPRLDVTTDLDGLDLRVARVATIRGRALDPEANPLRGAIVRADCLERPVLGTDVALTDDRGEFALRVPDGARCVLDATHPSFAGTRDTRELIASADRPIYSELTLETGCQIAGKVVDARGEPAGDGAIERRDVGVNADFGPAGQLGADGSFRWGTASFGLVRVRAWPWGSPPSNTRTFSCDGSRVDDVVFVLPEATPDLHGVLLDRRGAPVPFAYIDMLARSADGIGQQERTDAQGRWRIYSVPPGPYELRAHVRGAGVVMASVTAPDTDEQQLRLRGTARLTGTLTSVVEGSFELSDMWCTDFANDKFLVEEPPRLIAVHGGTFAIDGLPDCKLRARARWHGQEAAVEADLSSGSIASVDLELGTPRTKHIHGVVRDDRGQAIAGATVSARTKDVPSQVIQTDDQGRYSLDATPGVTLRATSARRGSAEHVIGPANVDDERIDLVIR